MKKLITLMFALLCLAACGSDEKKMIQDEIFESPFSTSYSFDNKYTVSSYSETIRLYEGTELVWENPIEKVSMEIDHGYGEIEIVDCSFVGVFFFPNSYNVYAAYHETPSVYYYFYDIRGNLINKVFTKTAALLEQKCPWNESLCIIQIWPDVEYEEGVNYYQTFDENGNNEIYKCINNTSSNSTLNLDSFIKIPDVTRYVGYSDNYIVFVTINENEKNITIDASFNLSSFINEAYPNEEHSPRYEVAKIEPDDTTSVVTINITLYNGTKEQLKITLDNQNGNIVK